MDAEKIKIFVVDASEVWRKILIQHLTSAPDIEVVGEINSSQASIMMLDEINPDIVMLNVNKKDLMPVEDVIIQLKAFNPHIRVILCSDQINMSHVVSAAGASSDTGMHDFIMKPYKKEKVLRSVYECVHRPPVA